MDAEIRRAPPLPNWMLRVAKLDVSLETWTVSVCPLPTALCVSRFVGSTVPVEIPSSASISGLELPIVICVSASALSRTRRPPVMTVAFMPAGRPPAFDVLIAVRSCACVMPAVTVTVAPLSVNVPGSVSVVGKVCVPVIMASLSSSSVAPNPVIFAGVGEPAIGLAEKVFGSISSDPGTFASWCGVSG
jgi:hypothetical protein